LSDPLDTAALVVVDAQQGFADAGYWGERDNPGAEANIGRLVSHWRARQRPLVIVRHDSADPASPLHPSSPGNALLEVVGQSWDLLVTKSVNSAFHGSPDLHAWLRGAGVHTVVVCGITTNHCCETTARVGGNLGYDVRFALDATHTFDRVAPDGEVVPAATLARVTATNLHGEFATVVATADLVAE
jgi:nicotinamidase-related amidase